MTDEKGEPTPAAVEAPDGEPSFDLGVPSDETKDEPSRTRVEFRAGTIEGPATVVGEQHNTYYYAERDGSATRLSIGHFQSCPHDQVRGLVDGLRFDPGSLERLVDAAERHRLLLLAGEPELGKEATAFAITDRLLVRHGLEAALICRGLGRELQVDTAEIAGGGTAFRGRVLVLADALAGRNPDLTRFFRELDANALHLCSERLRQARSFLIVSSTDEAFDGEVLKRLRGLGVAPLVGPPSQKLLEEVFRARTDRLVRERLADDEPLQLKVKQAAAQHGSILAARLRTVPRVVRFVDEYLVEAASGRLDPERVLERMDDLTRWLLEDLAVGLETWHAALALVLCSVPPLPARGVSWLTFDAFRKAIREHLPERLGNDNEPQLARELCRGASVMEHARAEVLAAPYPEPDGVRFKDDRYPSRLWRVLLGPGRDLLSPLLPVLRDLAEAESFGSVAARSLGLIGQIAPFDVTFPLIERWSQPEGPARPELLGSLLQGVLASEDASYREGCVARFFHLSATGSATKAEIAMLALREVVAVDLDLAFAGMRRIAEGKLAITRRALRRLADEVLRHEAEIRASSDRSRTANRLDWLHARALAELDKAVVSAAALPVLNALQYSLVGPLFAQPHQGPVLKRLTTWIEEDDKSGAALAYVTLRLGGLAAILQRYPVRLAQTQGKDRRRSRFLLSAESSDDQRQALERFLAAVYRALRELPPPLDHLLKRRFFALLTAWAEEACEDADARRTVVALLGGLRAAADEPLRSALFDFLRQGLTAAAPGPELRRLAAEIATWRPPRRGVSAFG